MSALIDKRDMTYDRLGAVEGADAFLESTGPDDATRTAQHGKLNRFTGHLGELRTADAPGFAAQDETRAVSDADYIARAKAYLTSVSEMIGFAPEEPVEFEADPAVTTTSEGMRVVSLRQTLNGIEVWAMSPKVWLHEGGRVDRIVGQTASVPADTAAKPAVLAETALRVAAAKAAEPRTLEGPFGTDELPPLDLSEGFERLSHQPRNDQPMTFSKGPFEEPVPARLVYLNMGDHVRLTWLFVFSRENLAAQYQALVEADDRTADISAPEILYFYDTTDHAVAGHVFRQNPGESTFDEVPFPLPASDYPTLLPTGFPPEFMAWTQPQNGSLTTEGNNVRALNGTSRQPVRITLDNAGNGVFKAREDTPEQFVTNIFYFCNYMHDFFMTLGFTEEHGNFQTTNPTGLGKGADPVLAFAHPGPVFGTANMSTRADGLAAVMNMGLVRSGGRERHTANDADVVFHEFVHGVTNRLVGGLFDANGLQEEQSQAMGEGWGDYFALTTRNFSHSDERVVTGSWVVGRPEGIRQRPYDSRYPGSFGDIGKGPGEISGAGNEDLTYQEVHDVGEIWCAALMEVTRKVSAALGDKKRGYRLTWQAVVDGLKLTPKDPSFLMARDAVLSAFKAMRNERGPLTAEEYEQVRGAAWSAFARFGMGFDAFCPNASFFGCRGGTRMPPPGRDD